MLTPPRDASHGRIGAAQALRRGVDALVLLLAVVAVVAAWHRVVIGDEPVLRAGVASLLAGVLVAVYALGASGRRWTPGLWVGALGAAWVVLLVVEPTALWLAFPLMFVELHVLGRRVGLVAVGGTVVVAALAGVARGLQPVGSILGPVLGAAVAVGVVRGLEAIARESAARLRIIGELEAARTHLADVERVAAIAGERERLAREIHDTLAQGFSSVELLLRAADASLADGDVARARELLDRTRAEARRDLEEARRFVRDLVPTDLASSTLADALGRVADRAAAGSDAGDGRGDGGRPAVDVTVTGDPFEVPVVVEAALLRVGQSAVANALEHASAQRVALTLTFLDAATAEGSAPALVLDVVDDGCGFDSQPGAQGARVGNAGVAAAGSAPTGRGFGLVAMRSRLAELGGTLVVESAPGRGTAVSARVPLAADRAGRSGTDA